MIYKWKKNALFYARSQRMTRYWLMSKSKADEDLRMIKMCVWFFLLSVNWSNVFKNVSLPTKIFKTVCVMIVEDMLTLLKLAPVSEVLLAENLGQDFQRLCSSFWKIKSEYFRWLHGLLVLRVLHWKVILIASQLHVSSALNIPCILKCRNFLLTFEAVSC